MPRRPSNPYTASARVANDIIGKMVQLAMLLERNSDDDKVRIVQAVDAAMDRLREGPENKNLLPLTKQD